MANDTKLLGSLSWKILVELQKNARISYKEIGDKIGLTGPAVAERIQKLEEKGIIKGRLQLYCQLLLKIESLQDSKESKYVEAKVRFCCVLYPTVNIFFIIISSCCVRIMEFLLFVNGCFLFHLIIFLLVNPQIHIFLLVC
jgi:DNA-binding Lrp family transcriptional regulator